MNPSPDYGRGSLRRRYLDQDETPGARCLPWLSPWFKYRAGVRGREAPGDRSKPEGKNRS